MKMPPWSARSFRICWSPNSFYNADKTEQRRQEARQHVEPVTTTIARNEVVLRAGDIVSAADIETLDALGLRQTTWAGKDCEVLRVHVRPGGCLPLLSVAGRAADLAGSMPNPS